MTKYELLFYDLPNGDVPCLDFLKSLNTKLKAKMVRAMDVLSENGTNLREPYSKPIEDGIFELRAQVGTDTSRIMYFFYDRGNIILTNGFVKKTNKTPRQEIEKAKKYRAEYLSRSK